MDILREIIKKAFDVDNMVIVLKANGLPKTAEEYLKGFEEAIVKIREKGYKTEQEWIEAHIGMPGHDKYCGCHGCTAAQLHHHNMKEEHAIPREDIIAPKYDKVTEGYDPVKDKT